MTQDTKREARPDVGASERAKVETGPDFQTGPHLHHKFTTLFPPGQSVKIADFLCTGQAHAVPLRDLVALTGWSGRAVRLAIRKERLSGVPILESSKATGGYFLPDSDHERARCVQRLRHRAAQIIAVADALAAADIQAEVDA